MNKFFEYDVLEEIRDYAIQQLLDYSDVAMDINCSEIGWLLTEEINANGSITYSREEARQFLLEHPLATDTTIRYMIESGLKDFEDIYYPEDAADDEINGTYNVYIQWNAEEVHVTMYIAVVNDMIGSCPFVQQHWNEKILLDETATETIVAQLHELDLDEIEIEA